MGAHAEVRGRVGSHCQWPLHSHSSSPSALCFRRGLPHGRGQGVGADGEAYDGEWVGGQREGRGTCRYASGDVYEGEWAGGKRHGRGVCRFADGVTFRGLWEGDLWVQAGADAERSEAEGAGLGRAVAGETAAFRVQVRRGWTKHGCMA